MAKTKAPTRAEIKKLAARKNIDVEDFCGLGPGRSTELWWAESLIMFAAFHGPLDNPLIRCAVYGALKGLPNKKRG